MASGRGCARGDYLTVSFLNWGVHVWRPSHIFRPTPTTVEPLRVSPPEAVAYLFELEPLALTSHRATTTNPALIVKFHQSCLHELPVDILKLDHTFVAAAEQETRALRSVDGVVRMAHAIGLEVVAEGVERPEQRDLMMRAGCDFRVKPIPS